MFEKLKQRWFWAHGFDNVGGWTDEERRCAICGKRVYPCDERLTVYGPGIGKEGVFVDIHLWHGDVYPELQDCLTGQMIVLRHRRVWNDYWVRFRVPIQFAWGILREIGLNVYYATMHPRKYARWRKVKKEFGL